MHAGRSPRGQSFRGVRVFPRRRPDLTEAQAEQREAMRAHPPADAAKE